MNTFPQDIRQALRALVRAPGFAVVAVLTIALGIGANTAIYSLVHHVLFRPVPFLDADRLVAIWQTAPGGDDHNEFSPADFFDVRAESRALDRVVAYTGTNANLTGGDRPERVQGYAVTSGYFDALGVRPMLGGAFADGENARGSDAVVLLTHALWTRRFGADSGMIGRTIDVNGRARQVVGVLPRDVRYPPAAELYVPWAPTAETIASRRAHFLLVAGRLAPGATVDQAHAEVAGIARRLAAEHPESNARWGALVRPFLPDLTRMMRPVLVVLLGAVGFVLGRGIGPVAIGGIAGLVAAAGLGRALGSQLVGVPAIDPVTYLVVSSLLFAAAVLAIYIPARRVARVDPMVVLRNEGEA